MEKQNLVSRYAIIELVGSIATKKLSFDKAFFDVLQRHKITDKRDIAFIKLVSMSLLRRYGQVNHILDSFVKTKLPKKHVFLKNIILVGITEILFIKTAPYACVNSLVEIAKEKKLKKYTSLINGVLRNVQRSEKKLGLEEDENIKKNVPNWLLKSWVNEYGKQAASEIININLKEPNLDFSVKSDPKKWEKELNGEIIAFNTIRKKEFENIKTLKGFDSGDWWIQDVSASIAVEMMGDIRGKKVADLCSAPGGKTFQLISKGAKTTAFDRSENRIKTLKENLERLNLKAEIINQDCKKWLANNDNDFDIILLDAPCSATGTIRKNPDVMINKKHSNILEYAKTQKQLLNQATKSLKKGGVLYYCVCSIQPEEGQAQIDKILKENKKLERLEFTHKELEQKKAESLKFIITEKGDIRILPFYLKEKGGMDGFFLARIARRK